MIRVCTTCRSSAQNLLHVLSVHGLHVLQLIHVHGRGKRRDFRGNRLRTQPEFTLYAGWKAAPATVEPGAGDNGNDGGNGDSFSANANVNVNTVNNNGDNASSEAKMATVKTGDNLALVGGAIAVIAVAAAGVAAFALRRRKMN